jgi:predicted O-linked N-acetylglucosamine transferase (SPINDLY family)
MSKNIDKLQFVKNYLFDNRKKFKLFDSKNLAENLSAAFKDMILTYNKNA